MTRYLKKKEKSLQWKSEIKLSEPGGDLFQYNFIKLKFKGFLTLWKT